MNLSLTVSVYLKKESWLDGSQQPDSAKNLKYNFPLHILWHCDKINMAFSMVHETKIKLKGKFYEALNMTIMWREQRKKETSGKVIAAYIHRTKQKINKQAL